jgi:xanthine dehydrogenase accessory factor
VRATFEALVREAIPRERLATVHAPVGLDLGARTPAEIAVSVAAELVQHGRGGSGRPLCEVERVLERFLGRDASLAAPGSRGS